ncbi:MAG: DUF6020 family protein [Candidatus Ventricola sp.]
MQKKNGVWIVGFSLLFSACVTVGRRITFSGDVISKLAENYIGGFSGWDALFFVCLAAAAGCVLSALERHASDVDRLCLCPGERRHPVRFACLAAACLLLCWLPYLLTVAPGIVYPDSMESIGQMLKHGHPTSNHHPIFYTLAVGVFLKLGSVLWGSVSAGVLLYSAFQTLVMIGCIVLLLTILYARRVRGALLAAALAYFACMPIFPNFAMTVQKDPLYACMLLLLSILLYALLRRKQVGLWWPVCYAAAGVGTMMLRNNGLYVFAATLAIALWLERRHARRLLAASAVALAVYGLLFAVAARAWNAESDFAENVGIPLQQLGYAVNNDGRFTEEERAYLFRLMPEEVWHYAYRPCLVDPIKWNPQFDYAFLRETRGMFFRVWLGGLVKNPAHYVRGYLLATFGFWKPGVQNIYGYAEVKQAGDGCGIVFMDLFERIFGFSLMDTIRSAPVILGSGTLLWLVLLGCVLSVLRSREGLVPYLPALLNWATIMIATPVAFSLRYVLVFALGLPLYLLLPVLIGQKNSAEAAQSLDMGGRIAYNISDIRQ